jgi:LacI family transcriptional regulator
MVREKAREMGYVPNRLIKAVLKGRTRILGVYLRWEQWYSPVGYWMELLWALQRAVAASDHQILIHSAHQETSDEEVFARQVGGFVDGVFVFNSANDGIVRRMAEVGMATVEVGDPFTDLPYVASDGPAGVRLALQHLKQRGYQRPACLVHESNFAEDQNSRLQAYIETARGLWEGDHEAFTARLGWPVTVLPALGGMPGAPDSVICASDSMAYRLYREALAAGMKVPGDLAIVGFDALATLTEVPVLTSVRTPIEKMADAALSKMLALIEGKEFEAATLLQPSLRIGETT